MEHNNTEILQEIVRRLDRIESLLSKAPAKAEASTFSGSPEECLELADSILSKGINDTTRKFVDGIRCYIQDHGRVSPKQVETLVRTAQYNGINVKGAK